MAQQAEFSVSAASQSLEGGPFETFLANALVPTDDGYARQDILLAKGKIAKILPAGEGTAAFGNSVEVTIDCTEKMLLPGFVNAHTHSTEHWAHGLIKPLPLELWVGQLLRHEPRGDAGWYGKDSFAQTPAEAVGVSALHCGVETLLSGCTAILDHVFIRHLDDLDALVRAYKVLGIRAFIAPMLNDDALMYENYIPLATDAELRNGRGCNCGGLGKGGCFRTKPGASSPEKTQAMLDLWEAAVKKYHDPEAGIDIVIGPVTAYSASADLLRGAAELRKKYDLCGHTHLLETRAQALMARQFLPSGSAVRHLHDAGFLQLRGTSCAHTVWLDDEEFALMAADGAACVHNPLSNLRLGSGVMPVKKALDAGVTVAMGCDGSCSSDGQDMMEALKLATMLPPITTAEYRDWPWAREAALTLAAKNGYKAVGMDGRAGELKEGQQADVTLWDLTSLALLPRTDPLGLLVLGSRTQAPGAGSTLHSMWVRGIRVVNEGSPCGLNLQLFRAVLAGGQLEYRSPDQTDPRTDEQTKAMEVEYRAAMGLDGERMAPVPEGLASYPDKRVLYDATLP
mmetsp:Transcript_42946/g.78045  ORF Transcript_42946/g.78045 Transcript_42946/m.78045 type:complete len:569 (-) Transcript_42946:49-1755(-)